MHASDKNFGPINNYFVVLDKIYLSLLSIHVEVHFRDFHDAVCIAFLKICCIVMYRIELMAISTVTVCSPFDLILPAICSQYWGVRPLSPGIPAHGFDYSIIMQKVADVFQ